MKRLLMYCLPLTLIAADSTLLLPHSWQDARHAVTSIIATAPSHIVIVTDALGDTYVRRGLRHALETHKHVTLITASALTASQWAIYQDVDACVLSADGPVGFSLVSGGESACTMNMPLNANAMRSTYGIMLCTDADAFAETVTLLKRECKDYFHSEDE
jgi:hypothetical protein